MFKHALFREVAVIVGVKTVIVIAAAFLIFGPRQRPQVDTQSVEARIIAPAGTAHPTEARSIRQ
jgi:hypothetical protein